MKMIEEFETIIEKIGDEYIAEIEKDERFDLFSYKIQPKKFAGVVIAHDSGFDSKERAIKKAHEAYMCFNEECFICLCKTPHGKRFWRIVYDIDDVSCDDIFYTSVMSRDQEHAQEIFEANFFALDEWESGVIETPDYDNVNWFNY